MQKPAYKNEEANRNDREDDPDHEPQNGTLAYSILENGKQTKPVPENAKAEYGRYARRQYCISQCFSRG